jgi:RND family efflux transporter MFP subunit
MCKGLALLLILLSLQSHAEPDTVSAEPSFQIISLTGFTRARKVLSLSSEIAGKVEQVYAELGEEIPESGLFACLDRTFIELDRATNQSEQARISAEITYHEKQRERFRSLVKTSSSAQAQLDETERSVLVFQQQLKVLQINQQSLAERRRRHCLQAPAGWLVIERQLEPYQWITSGQTVAEIGDFSSLLIPFAFTQPELHALQQSTQGLVLNFPDLAVTSPARIRHIAPGFDPVSRKIQVELEIDASGQLQRGGLRAELKLSMPDALDAVLIPKSAVQERYEEYWLTRSSGEEIRVVYLGEQRRGDVLLARVVSDQIRIGDQFLVNAE